jgi:hypothetical protein
VWMRTQRSSLTESSVRTHESLYTLAAPGPVQKAAVMGPRRVVTRRPLGHGVALVVAAAESGAFGQTRVLGGRRVAGAVVFAACPLVLRGWMVLLFEV